MRNSLLDLLLKTIASDVPADGAVLAYALTQLAECEVSEGGPYAAEPGGLPDFGLNLAVAVFLNMHGVRLPKLDAFITTGKVESLLLTKAEVEGLLEQYTSSREQTANTPLAFSTREQAVADTIHALALERFAGLPESFSKSAVAVIERTMRGNPDKQMSLMPLYMRQALGNAGERFKDDRLAELGLANVFFWTAFIIYDDFWDEDEAAEPRLLPVANLFARHYVHFFENVLPPETGFPAFFHKTMDKLDAANEWEMVECRLVREGDRFLVPERLPDYGDFTVKFNPASGHVLGPVAMLVETGYALDSKEVTALVNYFRHYLVAMQLNDDAHDWKEDLARGHISTAVTLLLAAWKAAHPGRVAIDPVKDLPELERLFWFETLVPLCEAALAHTTLARKALSALTMLEDPAPLERFIELNERIAQEAIDEHARSIAFLAVIPT